MNEALRMSAMTSTMAVANWKNCIAPMLQRALDAGPDWADTDGLLDDLVKGFARIIIVWDPSTGKTHAVLYLEGLPYQKAHVLSISYCAGDAVEEWMHLYPALRQYAKDEGFDQLAFNGRRGWGRLLKQYATVHETMLFTDKLDDIHACEEQEAASG